MSDQTKCSSCSRGIPQDSRLCPYCAEVVEAKPGEPTVTGPPKAAALLTEGESSLHAELEARLAEFEAALEEESIPPE